MPEPVATFAGIDRARPVARASTRDVLAQRRHCAGPWRSRAAGREPDQAQWDRRQQWAVGNAGGVGSYRGIAGVARHRRPPVRPGATTESQSAAGYPSLRAIAAELNRRSIPPESGRGEGQAVQVARALEKIGR